MASEKTQLAALSRLFSVTVFRELARYGRSPAFARLYRSTCMNGAAGAAYTVADAFDAAFAQLKREGCRDEYVYRAALTQKLLLGRHSLRTASMLSEFRVGESKADLVILNGTAAAYEIKSERDSLDRLQNQINNYKKVFASVNVIASESHVKRVSEIIPDDVGVLCLTRRYQISVEREAMASPDSISPVAVFESVRSREAQEILRRLDLAVPDVPNTKLHREMKEAFANQDPESVHREMVATLKRTRNLSTLAELVEALPSSLHAAALSTPLKSTEHERLARAVSVRLADALQWD